MRNLPWSHERASMLHLLFSPFLSSLFLLQYLKTYGEQLSKISERTKTKSLFREVSSGALIFLFPLLLLFLPSLLACPCLCHLTCCEWKEHLHTWWQWLSSNEPRSPPSLRTVFRSAEPPAARSAFDCCRGLGTLSSLGSSAYLRANWSRCY